MNIFGSFWASLRPRLIVDGKWVWTKASVIVGAIGASAVEIWNQLPDSIRQYLPHWALTLMPAVFIITLVIARTHKKPDAPQAGDAQ